MQASTEKVAEKAIPAFGLTERRLFALAIAPFFINGVVNAGIWQMPALFWGAELLYWVLMPVVVLEVARKRYGLTYAALGMHTRMFGKAKAWLLVPGVLLFSLVAYVIHGLSRGLALQVVQDFGFFSYAQVLPANPLLHQAVAIYLALSAALVEEIYFRGWLHRLCNNTATPQLSFIAISTLLFALIHWENGLTNILIAAAIGLFFALSYLDFRNLWPLIIGHFVIDYLWLS